MLQMFNLLGLMIVVARPMEFYPQGGTSQRSEHNILGNRTGWMGCPGGEETWGKSCIDRYEDMATYISYIHGFGNMEISRAEHHCDTAKNKIKLN